MRRSEAATRRRRVRLLAFHWLGTLVDAVAITRGLLAPTGRGPDTPGGGHPGGRS